MRDAATKQTPATTVERMITVIARVASWCDIDGAPQQLESKTNPSWREPLAFGHPVELPVFAVATGLVFATDAAVATGLSLHHHGGDSTDASVVF
jgi:hypothetical protein